MPKTGQVIQININPKGGVPTLVHDGNRRLELAGRRERLPDEALDGVSQRPMLGHSLQQASAGPLALRPRSRLCEIPRRWGDRPFLTGAR